MSDSQEELELMQQYEAEKKALQALDLSAEEYEREVKRLADRLGV